MLKRVLPYLLLLALFNASLYAGTGGAEISSWYTEISADLQGSWGKLGAIAFVVLAMLALKSGGIIPSGLLFFLGMSIGTIPNMVDSRYTMLF